MFPHGGRKIRQKKEQLGTEPNREGFRRGIENNSDFLKEVLNQALEINKELRELGLEEDKIPDDWSEYSISTGGVSELSGQKRTVTAEERKRIMGDISEKIGRMSSEDLIFQRQQLLDIILDDKKMQGINKIGREFLRRIVRSINGVIAHNEKKEAETKEEKSAREIFEHVLKDPKYINELFSGDDISVKNLKDAGTRSDEDFAVKFGEGDDARLLICKVRVTSRAEEIANKFKWFGEEKDLTISVNDNEDRKRKPIYVNLILQKEHLSGLQSSIANGEHRGDLVSAVRGDLEAQTGIILLSRIRKVLKGRENEEGLKKYFLEDEKSFREGMTAENKDFAATVEEVGKYIEENIPEIKNDPVISNVLRIMDRMNTKKEKEQEESEIA